MAAPPTVLLVLRGRNSSPGQVAEELTRQGYALDARRPLHGDELPAEVGGYAGAVSFGGAQSVHDAGRLPGLAEEMRLIERLLAREVPFLGVCLGAQLLAAVLGAKVGRHAEELDEIGYFEVRATSAGRWLFERPMHFYQWHREGFELPAGCRRLARSERFENQAYGYRPSVLGIQFHPEVTLAQIVPWTKADKHLAKSPAAHPHARQVRDFHAHNPGVRAWLARFIAEVWPRPGLGWTGCDAESG
jgi:GMP synthase (glutamine-hydrolysing)